MSRHLVRFYDGAYPAVDASDFIAAGLMAGDACIAILSQPNRQAVEQALNAHRMFSTPARPHAGTYCALDTHEVLSQLVVDGRLDKARAAESLGAMLVPVSPGGSVRVVGDLGPVLFAQGHEEDALALEGLVDSLAAAHSASIFCAYPIQHFHRQGHSHSLVKMCAQHTELAFPCQAWADGFVPPPPIVPDDGR